jgi:hypothetical protein
MMFFQFFEKNLQLINVTLSQPEINQVSILGTLPSLPKSFWIIF